MNEEGIVSNYKMEDLNDLEIQKFLKMNNLNGNTYFFAVQTAKLGSYALLGSLAALTMANYIVYYDNKFTYLFELSKVSNKIIVNYVKIDNSNIASVTSKLVFFKRTNQITINLKDGKSKFVLKAATKINKINLQNENAENYVKMFNNVQ